MTPRDIIRMAREAGLEIYLAPNWDLLEQLECYAYLVAAHEREKVAKWITGAGYITGHGDTIEDLLAELEWQITENKK